MFVSCTSLPRPPVIVPSGCDQTEGVKGWSDDISSIRMWLQNQSCHAMPARETQGSCRKWLTELLRPCEHHGWKPHQSLLTGTDQKKY